MAAKKSILLLAAALGTVQLYAQTDNDGIKKSINTFFEGFGKGDTSLMATVMMPGMSLRTIIESKEGNTKVHTDSRNDFMRTMAAPRKQKYKEEIVSWDIRTDGSYANAWCGYIFYLDTVNHHHGTDDFQLVKINDTWKILSITDTRRKDDPNAARIISNIKIHPDIEHAFTSEEELRKEINVFMDSWHRAAAKADEKNFFGSMDSVSIYLGTDKTENWTKPVFEKWSAGQFKQEVAWDFKPYDRRIYFSKDREYAWFDELLDTWMGVCRGSGVLHWQNGKWKIKHYNLAVTIANEKIDKFIKINK